ncbi:hypothetical protein SLA2020_046080 [Shorea laevis]
MIHFGEARSRDEKLINRHLVYPACFVLEAQCVAQRIVAEIGRTVLPATSLLLDSGNQILAPVLDLQFMGRRFQPSVQRPRRPRLQLIQVYRHCLAVIPRTETANR